MDMVPKILRYGLAFIDSGIVWVLKTICSLFYDLANIMLYSEDIIQALGQRIGLVLGIFMLFRLAVSLITYLISPDKLNDSAKGGGKILLNVVVSLGLLVTINIIFVQAYRIQNIVVSSNFIEKIFFGTKATKSNVDISYYLYTPLFAPNVDSLGEACSDLWSKNTQTEMGECSQILDNAVGSDKRAIYQAINNQDVSIVLQNWTVVTAKYNGDYVFDYKYVAPIVGIVASIILISFSMDLAVRAIKLLFLQIIAPIPIISNMDPGKGQDMFKKWYQECFKTYISVFIRLLTIDFATFMITIILTNFAEPFKPYPFINVMLIIGALIFAKQVPKLIEDMFGIKTDGMVLNPLKRFQEQALFGKNIIGLGAAGLAGGAAFGTNMIATRGNIFKRLGSGIAGMTSATARGAVGAIRGQNFGQVFNGAYGGANTARNNRASRNALGVKPVDVWNNSLQRRMGIDTEAELQDENIKFMDEFVNSAESAVSISEGEIDKRADKINLTPFDNDNGEVSYTDNTGARQVVGTFNTLAELREAMADTTYDAAARAAINAKYNKLRGDIAQEYRKSAREGTIATDARFSYEEYNNATGTVDTKQIYSNSDTSVLTVKAHIENIEDIYSKHKNNEAFEGLVATGAIDTTGKILDDKAVSKQVRYVSTKTKNSQEFRRQHAIQEQTNRERK